MKYRDRLPSLNALRSFEAAARHSSLLKAAEELNVTQSAISRLVKQLETELDVKLFRRLSKGVALTEAGETYLPSLTRAFDTLAAATQLIAKPRRGNRLNITLWPTMAMRWLMPRLPQFYALYPHIRIDVSIGNRLSDDETPTDIGILRGNGNWPNMEATFLLQENVVLVGNPKLLTRKPIQKPNDVLHHVLLVHSRRPQSWTEWFAKAGLEPSNIQPGPIFEHFFMTIDAARSGMGLALVPRFLIEDLLQSRQLITPLDVTLTPEKATYLVHAKGRAAEPHIKAFRQWILSELSAEQNKHAI